MKKFFVNIFRFIGALLALMRGIMVIGMLVIGVITVYLINTAYQVTINQYNESLTWENTAYTMSLSEIEPALVSNVVDTDIVTAAAAWEELDQYLDSLDGKAIDKDKAEDLLEQAIYWQEIYNLQSDSITRLSLYLELEDAISRAYITLDTTEIQALSLSLYNLELEETTKTGQLYMERLAQVSSDFAEAKNLMTDTILSVGTLKKGVWTIPYTYTRTNLTDILEQIQTMQKFPALCNTAEVLSDIADVLNYNKNAREYFEYQDFMEQVNRIRRSEYVAVSSIYTYGQAQSYRFKVDVQDVPGFTVSSKSPVTGIYYGGERLNDSDYIRKGANVTVWIDEIYEPIPEPEPDPESQLFEIPMEEGIDENEW